MSYVTPADRSQYVLMNTLDDLVPSNHPVHLIEAIVEKVVADNPNHFGRPTIGDVGRPEYSPPTLLKLYLYGFVHGIRSSRRLEAETRRNIEVMWLLGMLSPDHWTVSQFRKEHRENIKFVTKEFRRFLHDTGYIKGERVSIDGSKMKANAKREMLTLAKIEKRMRQVDEKLEEYLNKLAENDAREDVLEELEQTDDTTERERQLVEKIVEVQQQLEALQQQKALLEQTGNSPLSLADPEAKLMRTRDGKMPAYNVQLVVDDAHKMIADSEVLTEQNDVAALPTMVHSLKEELGIVPKEILADTGYYNPALIEHVESNNTDLQCYIPLPEKPSDRDHVTFTYDAERNQYTCSEGKPLMLFTRHKQRRGKSLASGYRGTECTGCHLRHECTTSKRGRIVYRYHNQQWRDGYKSRMSTPAARDIARLRKSLAEHPFGTIKCLGGKIPLLLRGVLNVATEINLYTFAYNLKRLINSETIASLLEKVREHRWAPA